MSKQVIMEYMGWKECEYCKINFPCFVEHDHPLDGNDMVAAINKIVEKELWNDFEHDVVNYYWKDETADRGIMPWIFGNPQNFFKLMEEWLYEKAD